MRTADLLGPTPYSGQEPETEFRNDQAQNRPRRDYTTAPPLAPETFRFVATPLFVLVGDKGSDTSALLSELDWNTDKPFAAGELSLEYRWDASWKLEESNMSGDQIEKALKTYTKDQGWNMVGVTLPNGDTFGKAARLAALRRWADVPGIGEINPGVKDWRQKEWSGMEQFDNADVRHPSDYPGYSDQDSGVPMTALLTCSDCGTPCGSEDEFRQHVLRNHIHQGQPPHDPGPVVDLDDALPAGWNEVLMDQTDQRAASRKTLAHKVAIEQMIQGPIPYIYDIEGDRIYVGHPGERHSDIQGRFTPGGIIEGQYMPDGNVQIRTDTDMPYTIKHMVRLWYALHPELEIKAVHLLHGDQKHKLASSDIGNRVRNLLATDAAAYDAARALQSYGKVYVVGGAVRDVILGKVPRDFDLMVQGVTLDDAEDILSRLPGKVDQTGKSFGVLRYRNTEGEEVEVALPRKDFQVGDTHQDVEVHHDPFMSLEEDLGRRDFTANAIAVDLATGDLIDPHHGAEDIKRKQLEPVSNEAFAQDPLRILRTMSAISKHQLIPSRKLLQMIKDNAYRLKYLPAERIQAELDKMMAGDDPALAVQLLEDTGLFNQFLQEYDRTRGFDQKNSYHYEPLHDHLKTVLRETAKHTDDPDVRWAAWLHDIGKPRSQWINPETNKAHYYKNDKGHGENHWEVGADMSKELLERLKFPNNRVDRITHLVNHHMFPRFEDEKGARKFINRVGDQHADDLLKLRAADISGRQARVDDVSLMQGLVNQVREQGQPTGISGLAINGHDLISAGFQPGPQMGALLNYLANQVIEDPSLNTRDQLLAMATEVWDDQRTANILDPVQHTLDPSVFDAPQSAEPILKPRIIKWVRQLVYQTMIDAGWPDPSGYLNIILTGSLTTFQYSEHSDFDCSLWIDAERLPTWVRADLINLMITKCDGTVVPGTTHPMQCFVVDVTRFTREDIYHPGLRSAYDLDARAWITPPEHREVDIEKVYKGALAYARTVVDKVKLLLAYDKYGLKQYWHVLHKNRMRDMRAGKGDFTESNIVYKLLANEGLLPLIADATGEYIA